jgi:hypothetical protein
MTRNIFKNQFAHESLIIVVTQVHGRKIKIKSYQPTAMKIFFLLPYFISACLFFPVTGNAQANSDSSQKNLFETDEVLSIKLTGNIHELTNDKVENSQYHPLTLSYKAENGNEVSLSVEAKTRGHFRKTMGNCTYPPLLLHFLKNDTLLSTIFGEQNKLKLVMPCRGDEYVIHEWLVYKIYNLVTPISFRARLVTVELNDIKKKKITPPFYGVLLEEDQQLAKRNHNVLIKRQIRPELADLNAFTKMAVFEYLIGNTDWSVQYQNIKLVAADSNAVPITVPYDFDHAGVVNAPYAKPAEELNMNSVRERRYRGYCITDMKKFDEVISLYNHLRTDIYKLYTDCPLLDIKYVKATILYFDKFYQTINNPSALLKEFSYPCSKSGTGNVVIKGLRND